MCYYVNTIHHHFGVYLIIEENPNLSFLQKYQSQSFIQRLQTKNIFNIISSIKNRLFSLLNHKKIVNQHNRYNKQLSEILGQRAIAFNKDIPIKTVENINSTEVRNTLLVEKPDIILVQGTSIVKDKTLPKGGFNFNMHAGLSPYYRGGASIQWALINGDPYNIGVTLHKLTESPDAGSIIAQKRVIPENNDTVTSLNFKLTKAGTDLAIKILKKYTQGKKIKLHKQNLSMGKCYYSSQWHPTLTSYIKWFEQEGRMEKTLKRPSTKTQYPIIEI